MEEKKMPSQGLYLVLVILGFLLGILWGILALFPYNKMKAAIAEGDVEAARAQAGKVRLFVIIGLVVCVLYVIGNLAQAGIL